VHILMFKKKPSQLWYAGGGAVCGGLQQSGGGWERGQLGMLKKIPQRFYTKSPLVDSKDIQEKIDSIMGPTEYFNRFDVSHKLNMDKKIISHMVKADASWMIDIQDEMQICTTEEELPVDARRIREQEVNGRSWYTYYAYNVKVKRDYNFLSTLNLWTFDYDDEYRKTYTILSDEWFKTHLKREENSTKRSVLFQPYREEMSYGEFLDLFPEKYAENEVGDNVREVRFNWPNLYQYKTQFGVLNHLAV